MSGGVAAAYAMSHSIGSVERLRLQNALVRVRAAFEFFTKLGVE
jgi:hypothetical protein